MIFWASAEVFQPAAGSLASVRKLVDALMADALKHSGLDALPVQLRYVPIVMPEGMRERYPARSKLHKKEQTYDCAPQLDYDVFVNGAPEEQLQEYVRGIEESAPFLAELGATKEQVQEFLNILASIARSASREKYH